MDGAFFEPMGLVCTKEHNKAKRKDPEDKLLKSIKQIEKRLK